MKPYLIQRAKFNDRDHKKGIDSIIELSYMGSSEFEWGAVPDSLKRIRANQHEYTYLDVPIQGKTITIYCEDHVKAEVKQYLQDLAENKTRLKEWSDFDTYIYKKHFDSRTDFWWDIENDLMFWRKCIDFESKFKRVI